MDRKQSNLEKIATAVKKVNEEKQEEQELDLENSEPHSYLNCF